MTSLNRTLRSTSNIYQKNIPRGHRTCAIDMEICLDVVGRLTQIQVWKCLFSWLQLSSLVGWEVGSSLARSPCLLGVAVRM